jgi:hypothetical protein
MPGKPNFTSAELADGTLRVFGVSDVTEPPGNDILEIRVVLTQPAEAEGEAQRIASGSAAELSDVWQVDLPPEGFAPGAATAWGMEMRRTNATTTAWTERLDIE